MKRMREDYPLHPCTICAEPTRFRNYCLKHLKMYISPGFSPTKNSNWIDAEPAPSPRYRRHESANKL